MTTPIAQYVRACKRAYVQSIRANTGNDWLALFLLDKSAQLKRSVTDRANRWGAGVQIDMDPQYALPENIPEVADFSNEEPPGPKACMLEWEKGGNDPNTGPVSRAFTWYQNHQAVIGLW